eukprot:TRINITY_DN2144_c0_g1_i4.p1 TRINITY_DN2144_c0_g1~~TRINITY_DN2144_c0_g1_i4.p1  ORF type:complete len:1232 (-),score=200.95 TRINITY_DN2144_c0_g1_i4:2377-6072(-)
MEQNKERDDTGALLLDNDLLLLGDSFDETQKNPEESANIFSLIFHFWVLPVLIKGYKTPIQREDIYEPLDKYRCEHVTAKLERFWKYQLRQENPSLFKALFHCFKWDFFHAFVPRLIRALATFVGPYLLKPIIGYLKDDGVTSTEIAIIYCFIIFFAAVVDNSALQYYWQVSTRTGLFIKLALIEIVYNKSLKISMKSEESPTSGEIINFISNDLNKFRDVLYYSHFFWAGPLMLTVCGFMIYFRVGFLPLLSGYCVMGILLPLSISIANKMQQSRKNIIKKTSERMKNTNEVITFIKMIKLYTLETLFSDRIQSNRDDEIHHKKWFGFYQTFLFAINFCLIPMMTLATLGCYTLLGGEMSIEIAFPVLALYNVLQGPFKIINKTIVSIVEAKVALKRIQHFLLLKEISLIEETESEGGIEFINCDMSWDNSPTLYNIDLRVKKGDLLCIIGPVGAGKTSLLNSVLGEISLTNGEIKYKGSIAYVPQEPFLLNDTVRNNILFNKEYDEERYLDVISKCALGPDLEMLINSDHTLIGEKGINLSGGQKARIGLARAVYSNSDIYLLDDPLSAVDTHVSKQLFHECVQDCLKEKTVILVTHQLQYLSYADTIAIMKDGEISVTGTYDEISEMGIDLDELLKSFNPYHEEGEEYEAQELVVIEKKEAEENKAEERETGSVNMSVYWYYFKAYIFLWIITILFYILRNGSSVFRDFYLTVWSSTNSTNTTITSTIENLSIFSGLTILNAFFLILSEGALIISSLNTSVKMHNTLFNGIMNCPMSFFDTTPQGRIISRFSNDMEKIDGELPRSLSDLFGSLFNFISIVLLMVLFTSLWNFAVIIPAMFIFWGIRQFSVRSMRELSRLRGIANSPLFSHVEESINGSDTIRSSRSEFFFLRKLRIYADDFFETNYIAFTSDFLLANIFGFNTALITFGAILITVLTKGTVDSSLASLSLTYTLTSSKYFGWLMRSSADIEGKINGAERFYQYSELDQEDLQGDGSLFTNFTDQNSKYSVEFKNVNMRYREGLDLVLKDLSFKIKKNEKIGIVGRTGAGKSSLVSALFRLTEIESGSILVNGVDIRSKSVRDIRRQLAIIPQDPVIFSGSLRFNLDPYDETTDQEIWRTIELINFSDFVRSLPDGLYTELTQGGSMSVGQKQLLCIGRALLQKPSILFLDEATAGIDPETDSLIQNTIRNEFSNCTVLTIAHRLNTKRYYFRGLFLVNLRRIEYYNCV